MEWEINRLIHGAYEDFVGSVRPNVFNESRDKVDCAIMKLYGIPGSGKTRAALAYCERNPASLYFGFRGLTEELALDLFVKRYPRVFGSHCDTWDSFFKQLRSYAQKKRPVIFFDDPGERNDKAEFFEALRQFNAQMMKEGTAMAVLLVRPWDRFPVPGFCESIPRLSPPQLSRMLPRWTEEDVFRLYSLTDGIYGLTQDALETPSFAGYLEKVCAPDSHSAFLRLAQSWLEKAFRSPEAYNALLYGLSLGKDRIMELSAFTGYPKNKCEKYLCALMDASLVKKEKEDGRRPRYALALRYLEAWYRFVFPSLPRKEGLPGQITGYVENKAIPEALHAKTVEWISNHALFKMQASLHTTKSECENITIQGIRFDYVERTPDETVFAIAKMRFTDADWPAIERAVESVTVFYDAKIALCSMHLFGKFYWQLKKENDNIRLVQLKSLG